MRNNYASSRTLPQLLAGLLIAILLAAASVVPALADGVANISVRAPHTSTVLDTTSVWTAVRVRTVLVTGLIVMGCVILHYEAFIGLNWVLGWLHTHRRRQRLLVIMLALIVLHIIEIWIFAAGFYWLLLDPMNGHIAGIETIHFFDEVYFSAVCYTTLGLGDLVPHGAIRLLTATESLVGFLLITWSASFTFFEMERYWRKER